MAQRPFATHYVQFSANTSCSSAVTQRNPQFQQENSSNSAGANSKTTKPSCSKKSGIQSSSVLSVRYNSTTEESTINSPLLIQNNRGGNFQNRNDFCLLPLGIQPCSNERASVSTVLIQLPQNQMLSFGCVLTPFDSST